LRWIGTFREKSTPTLNTGKFFAAQAEFGGMRANEMRAAKTRVGAQRRRRLRSLPSSGRIFILISPFI
jgi:hypothetical protein